MGETKGENFNNQTSFRLGSNKQKIEKPFEEGELHPNMQSTVHQLLNIKI